jgi:hypothetical protein
LYQDLRRGSLKGEISGPVTASHIPSAIHVLCRLVRDVYLEPPDINWLQTMDRAAMFKQLKLCILNFPLLVGSFNTVKVLVSLGQHNGYGDDHSAGFTMP